MYQRCWARSWILDTLTKWIWRCLSGNGIELLMVKYINYFASRNQWVVEYKVKCTLVQAMRFCTGRRVHRGSRGIALPFHDHGTGRGEGSGSRPGRSLPPGKTRYPLYRKLGGPQGRSGQVRKILTPPGFDPRTVQPVTSRYTYYVNRPTNWI